MNRAILILSLIIFSGCFAHAPVKKIIPIIVPDITGNIVDGSKLKIGGTLGLSMLKAGPQAEAGEQLDHLSLMLLKGIRESLESQKSKFVLVDQGQEADFILEGYIEELYKPGKFQRLMLRKRTLRFSVSGEIWAKDTGKKVLTFASSKVIKDKKANLNNDAYQMGLAIGDFIVKQGNI